MGDNSAIQWTDATWNPIVGCSIVSAGCTNCYAMKDAWRKSFNPKTPQYHGLTKKVNGNPVWTGKVQMAEHKLTEPLRRRTPTIYFVNSMGDLFHEGIPDDWIDRVFAVMALAPQHTFQVLTKRPERMRDYISGLQCRPLTEPIAEIYINDPPLADRVVLDEARATHTIQRPLPNVWLGTSIEDQPSADLRIPHLLDTPAALRFVSYEPALAEVDFSRWLDPFRDLDVSSRNLIYRGMLNADQVDALRQRILDWIIIGGESGPGARPFDIQWARSAIAQCRTAQVPVFIKQLGRHPVQDGIGTVILNGGKTHLRNKVRHDFEDKKGGDPDEWPADLRVREMPGQMTEVRDQRTEGGAA